MAVTNDEKRFLQKLGLKLRALRDERKWTLEETEEHGFPDWKHLQKIESGRNVTIVTLKRVAKLYKLPLEKLLSGL
jgi:transcriptional regulator with XRE-family HTH domain